MYRHTLLFLLAIAALVAAFAGEAAAQGCAMCRTALGGADDPLSRGIFRSVLFLVSMPFALVLSVGGWLVYNLRRPSPDDDADPGRPTRVVPFRRTPR